MKTWTYKDENLFNKKLTKLGLVGFMIAVEKKIYDTQTSDEDVRYLCGVYDRLVEISNAKGAIQKKKSEGYKQKNRYLFAKR